MGYSAKHTASLIACLQKDPGREFTASELEGRTTVPKKFVRRALTVDDEKKARAPMDGVTMVQRVGLWRYSWTGVADVPSPQESN